MTMLDGATAHQLDSACINRLKGLTNGNLYFATAFHYNTLGSLTGMTTGIYANPLNPLPAAPMTPATPGFTAASWINTFLYTPEGLLQSLTATVNPAAPYTVTYGYTARRQLQNESVTVGVPQVITYDYGTALQNNLKQITRGDVSTEVWGFNEKDRLTNADYDK